jgi:hypothetical protein
MLFFAGKGEDVKLTSPEEFACSEINCLTTFSYINVRPPFSPRLIDVVSLNEISAKFIIFTGAGKLTAAVNDHLRSVNRT